MSVKSFISIVIIMTTSMVMAQISRAQDEEICYFKEKPLIGVLKEIRAKTGINFVYQNDLIENVKVNGKINKNSFESDLKKILLGSGFDCKEYGRNSVVLFPKKIKQEKYIEAYVVEEPQKENLDSIFTRTDAELLTNMELDYPINAVKNREHGNVNVTILVNREGGVCKSILQESSGSGILDSVAIAYTRQLKFIPASTNGMPRSSWVRMIFKYSLTER